MVCLLGMMCSSLMVGNNKLRSVWAGSWKGDHRPWSIARCDWLPGMQDSEMDLTSAAGVRDMHGGYLGISRDIL